MKKVLYVVCAMLLACSTMSMAELIGDDVQWDLLFSDESPYIGGERVRVSVLVINGNGAYQPIRLYWQMMDSLGNVAQGMISKNIYPYYAGTMSFGKPLPVSAYPGLYTWSGLMQTREADGSWQSIGQHQITFFVGDQGSAGPGGLWDFYCSLYPAAIAQGESFTMAALVGNGTENETDVLVQSYITTPAGGEYLLGPHPLTVGAMSNVSARFLITPHMDAPAGDYTVSQQLIDLDGQVLNQVDTGFSISGSTFSTILGDAILALAAIPEENKLDPEYDVAADVDNVLNLYNASDIQGALDQALAIIGYLPDKFTTAGDFAPALDGVVDYLEASLNMNFTYSMN